MRLFLDVGGFVGGSVDQALEFSFDRIYTFEPSLELYEGLKKKYRDEPRVEVRSYGWWNKSGPRTLHNAGLQGASIFEDKVMQAHVNSVPSESAMFAKASSWMANRVTDEDFVYLKLNCEGAEIGILEDLIETGEIRKVKHLAIELDALKVPSQCEKVGPMIGKLKKIETLCSVQDLGGFEDVPTVTIREWLERIVG